jgi:lysophospholipase L1-like esterase
MPTHMTKAVGKASSNNVFAPRQNSSKHRPYLWYDLSKPVYSNSSGYGVVTTNGSAVAFVPDQSGNNHHLRNIGLANSGANTHTSLALAAQNGLNGLTISSDVSIFADVCCGKMFDRGLTILTVVDQSSTGESFFLSFAGLTPFSLGLDPSGFLFFSSSILGARSTQYPADVATGIVTFRYDGLNIYQSWNGQYIFNAGNEDFFPDPIFTPVNLSLDPRVISGNSSVQNNGSFAISSSDNWSGNIYEIIVFAGALPQRELDEWAIYLNNKWGTPLYSATVPRLVCVGDSLTYGIGAGITNSWPTQYQALLGASAVQQCNFGASGVTAFQYDLVLTNQAFDFSRTGFADEAFVWLGTNDIALPPIQTATATEAMIESVCQQLQNKFANVYVANICNRGDVNITASQATINAWMAANWPSFAAGFADFASSPCSQVDTNTLYYQSDLVHGTTLRYGIYAAIANRTVNGLNPTVRGVTTGALASGTTATLPTTVLGDIIVVVTQANTTSGDTGPAKPSGSNTQWSNITAITEASGSGNSKIQVWATVASGGSNDSFVSSATATDCVYHAYAIENATCIDISGGQTGTGTTITAPSVTSTWANDLVISCLGALGSTPPTIGTPSSGTEEGPTTGTAVALASSYQTVAGIGATTAVTASVSGQAEWCGLTVAVR